MSSHQFSSCIGTKELCATVRQTCDNLIFNALFISRAAEE